MSLYELKEQCYAEIERCWEFAEERYNTDLWYVLIVWSNAMTRCAGEASFAYKKLPPDEIPTPLNRIRIGKKIKLSIPLLLTASSEFIYNTPAHEAAHIIEWVVYGRKSHGPKFVEIAQQLGIDGTRCHNFKIEVKHQKRYPIHCLCDTPHMMTINKITRMQNGTRSYQCKKCKTPLLPTIGS